MGKGKPKKEKSKVIATGKTNWQKIQAELKANTSRGRYKAENMGRTIINEAKLVHPLSLPRFRRKIAKENTSSAIYALDCEMVGVGRWNKSVLARVCLINEKGEVVLDKFVRPLEKVTDFRTAVSGIRPHDILNPAVESASDVCEEVRNIIKKKILVGHSIKHDLEVLNIKHHYTLLRDTATYTKFKRKYKRTQRLKTLAALEIGWSIQNGEHDPYIDALAALEIYKKHKESWERSLKR